MPLRYEKGKVETDGYVSFWKDGGKPILKVGNKTVGYEADVGKGKSVVIGGSIGARLTFATFYKTSESYLNEVTQFTKWLLSRINVKPVVEQDAPVEVIMRETPSSYFLFVINRGHARKVKINTRGEISGQPELLYRIFNSQIIGHEQSAISLSMDENDSMIIKLAKK
ncbi:MAG: hypothetical protein QXL15_04805 [Candidatus Korarchaeota archaeon]